MTRFLVEDWMMGCGLGLGGYEMPIFAYAYSFFREGKTLFASEGSIAALMGCSRKQAGIILKRLCEKGLLIRSETKHPEFQTYSYSVCEEKVRCFVKLQDRPFVGFIIIKNHRRLGYLDQS